MKTLVVDDERLARTQLKEFLSKYPHIEIIGEASNGNEAVEQIKKLKPELVFLDIEMPGKNGFEVLDALPHVPKVVFVTAYDEFAIKAFEANAIDYVLKPIIEDRLAQCVEKIGGQEQQDNADYNNETLFPESQIFVKDGEKCWFIKLSDVRLFESEGNYVRLYFNSNRTMVLKSLNHLEERLSEQHFFRASRKHIINLSFINKVDNWFNGGLRVHLSTGETIEISRRQSAKFKEKLSL